MSGKFDHLALVNDDEVKTAIEVILGRFREQFPFQADNLDFGDVTPNEWRKTVESAATDLEESIRQNVIAFTKGQIMIGEYAPAAPLGLDKKCGDQKCGCNKQR